MQSKTDKVDDSIINSLLQSNELKDIVKRLVQNEVKNSGNHESAIEKLTEIFSTSNIYEGRTPSNPSKHSSTIPINDLRSDKSYHSDEDSYNRCSLASLFRLIDIEGWAKSIYNIVSLRSNETNNNYYVNPFGLLYHEITASSLIKIDIDGVILDSGSTILNINHTNWLIHKSIYNSRPDVKCIIQVSLPDVVAISSIKCGLLPVSVEAVKLLDVSKKSLSGGGVKYHSACFDKEGKYSQMIEDLGQSKILFIRNYCLFVCATSIAEAWTLMKTVVAACQAQVRLIQLGGRDLLKSESNFTKMNTLFSDANFERKHSKEHDIDLEAELEYEAMMRLLDNAGYRTGHKYYHRQLTSHIEHSKDSAKLESISSSDNEESVTNFKDNTQVCPMPPEEQLANGDRNDDENIEVCLMLNEEVHQDEICDDTNIQVCPMNETTDEDDVHHSIEECGDVNNTLDVTDANTHNGDIPGSNEVEQMANEWCERIIDNSIKIYENEEHCSRGSDQE